jgi:hypothetical protein
VYVAELFLVILVQMLDSFWLASSSYVAGNQISIADLLLVTELDMLEMLAGATEVRSFTIPDTLGLLGWMRSAFGRRVLSTRGWNFNHLIVRLSPSTVVILL